jgi:uncharacterized protein YqjF (DUF2071 family)
MEIPTKEKRLAVRNKPETGEPLMYQSWKNILSLNWEYPADVLQERLPEGLTIDTFNGKAYIGITLLFMENVRPKYLPAFPGVSNFQEMNFRTYVFDKNGFPGIWFFSLDAGNRIAVEAAKVLINLPYNYSYIKTQVTSDNEITFSSLREDLDPWLLSLFRYKIKEDYRTAEPDTLDFFLIERYSLFTHQKINNEIFSGRVYHAPYVLKDVELKEWDDNLFEANGFQRPARFPDHVVITPDLDIEFFMLKKV